MPVTTDYVYANDVRERCVLASALYLFYETIKIVCSVRAIHYFLLILSRDKPYALHNGNYSAVLWFRADPLRFSRVPL